MIPGVLVASRAWLVGTLALLCGCSVALPFSDLDETSAARCSNRVDDDFDGDTDCDDPDCDGHCRENSATACANCRDDDGNGVADHADPRCWERAELRAGGATNCSSRAASTLSLARDAPDWRWGCGRACPPEHSWEPDPRGGGELVARFDGGEHCRGAAVLSSTCELAAAPIATTGGACWELEAEILLGDDDAELALVVAPRVGASPLQTAADAVVVSVARHRDASGAAEVTLSYFADGREPARAALPDTAHWMRLGIHASAVAGECHRNAAGPLSVTLELADGSGDRIVLDRWPDLGTSLRPPSAWRTDGPLELAVQSAAPGTAWVRALTMERERFDPCGFPVPQIAGDDGGAAVVVAAARGDGRICAVGATTGEPQLERAYNPRRHHAWPPDLGEDDPAPPPRRFASWHTGDRGIDSFGATSDTAGPLRATGLDALSVRAGELAWSEETGFEGVLLVSEEPRRGGRLVRISSPDCERWAVEPLDELSAEVGSAHPLLYELGPRRLVLAEPGGAYTARDDYRCCRETECPADDLAACEAALREGYGVRTPSTCFTAEADPVPYVKPLRSECMVYPRARLTRATSEDGMRWSTASLPAMPALTRWVLSCGCLASFINLPPRVGPSEAHQLLERAQYRAFIASGPAGIELVLDTDELDESFEVEDGRLLEAPLLAPSGVDGTFDLTRVSDGQLLWLGHRDGNPDCALEALLFYRGFHAVDRDETDPELVRAHGGAVGVIPVRIDPPADTRRPAECVCPE